ncbi:energy transducer TonB [Pseudooceanicola sp.]
MQTGAKISGAAHVGLILIALFWGTFSAEPEPLEVAQAALISAEEYAALSQTRQAPELSETPPQVPEPPAETAAPEPAPQPEPEPAPEVATPPEPAPAPEAPPVVEPEPPTPEVAEAPAPEPAPVEAPEAPQAEPQPRPIERVAPEVVAAPLPDVRRDEETREAVAEAPGADTRQEAQDAAAPEEATDRIVPETPEVAALAPERSVRPRARVPQPPAREAEPVQTAQTEPEPAPEPEVQAEAEPEPQPETPRADTRDAVNDALAQALGGGEEVAAEPAGPPLSAGEKESLRVAVSRCWNVGSLSSAALNTTVVVSVAMQQDGRPDTGSIRMLSSSGGDSSSARQAFEAARRAIIRCGGSGFDLPTEKYAHWRDIEMTFNPERMRIR